MRQLSNQVKRKMRATDKLLVGWDALIRDARKRIEDLNFSIQVFEKRKAAGDICPTDQQHVS